MTIKDHLSIEQKILTLLQFGETSIDQIFKYCEPAMQSTVRRKLRGLESKDKIKATQWGTHGSKIAYKLT